MMWNAECSLFMRIIQADVVGRGATEDLMVAVISYNFLIIGEEGFSLLVGTGNQLTLLHPMR